MPYVNVDDIPTSPENALLKWQIALLKLIKHKYDIAKVGVIEYLWLDEKEFSEIGLKPLSKRAQKDAIESMNNELWPSPIYETESLPDYTKNDVINKSIIGYTVTVFSIKKLDEFISDKIAQLNDISKIKISFKITAESAAIVVNGSEIAFGLGTWKGRIVKALQQGDGEANYNDISGEENTRLVAATKRMVTKNVGELNAAIAKHTGIKKLLFGQSVVKFNKNLYLIDIED